MQPDSSIDGRDDRVDNDTIGVILNPAAAGGKTIKLLPLIAETLDRSGRRHDIYVTSFAGETMGVGRQMLAQGHGTLVAIGGDGTINEVASAILESGEDATLGIIPSGHGSDLARTLAIPKETDKALYRILRGSKRHIDAGMAQFDDGSRRHFVNVAGLGFDSVVARYAMASKLPGSTLPYIIGVLKTMRVYKNMEMKIEAGDQSFEGRACSVIVANAKFFAGGMKIAPMADIADGKLDIAILGDLGRFELARATPSVYKGNHVNHKKFTHFPATEIRVTTERAAIVQVDGELASETPVTFSVQPGALQVFV